MHVNSPAFVSSLQLRIQTHERFCARFSTRMMHNAATDSLDSRIGEADHSCGEVIIELVELMHVVQRQG